MGETALVVATAQVMIYDDSSKVWVSPDRSSDGSLARVQLLQNRSSGGLRIVALRAEDGQWLLDCRLHQRLKYHPATTTFHQWRDEQRQVYGLNFPSEGEATRFSNMVLQAIEVLAQQGDHYAAQNEGLYQDPHQHVLHHNQSAPTLREDPSAASYRKSSHSVQSNGGGLLSSQQRRASQGSSASSSNGSAPCYASGMNGAQNSPSRMAPPTPPTSSVPPAPPPPLMGGPPAPPPPPPATTSGGPPPPPPMPANLFDSKGGASSLAEQLKANANKLKNVSNTGGNSTPAVAPKPEPKAAMDMMSELAATINRRKNTKANIDETDSKSNGSTDSAGSTHGNGLTNGKTNGVVKKWEPVKTNGLNGHVDSPKTHRKVPSGSSLSSQEEPQRNGSLTNGSSGGGPITHELLERFKADLMLEVKAEIERAKQEIIAAFRQEMNRR